MGFEVVYRGSRFLVVAVHCVDEETGRSWVARRPTELGGIPFLFDLEVRLHAGRRGMSTVSACPCECRLFAYGRAA